MRRVRKLRHRAALPTPPHGWEELGRNEVGSCTAWLQSPTSHPRPRAAWHRRRVATRGHVSLHSNYTKRQGQLRSHRRHASSGQQSHTAAGYPRGHGGPRTPPSPWKALLDGSTPLSNKHKGHQHEPTVTTLGRAPPPWPRHLFLLQLADLLLHHGDLAVHAVHALDQLLLGQPRGRQLQLGVGVRGAGGGHWLQLARQAAVLSRRENRCGVSTRDILP